MGDILRRGTRDKPPIIGPLRSVTLIRSEFVVMLCRAMRPLSVKTTRSAALIARPRSGLLRLQPHLTVGDDERCIRRIITPWLRRGRAERISASSVSSCARIVALTMGRFASRRSSMVRWHPGTAARSPPRGSGTPAPRKRRAAINCWGDRRDAEANQQPAAEKAMAVRRRP